MSAFVKCNRCGLRIARPFGTLVFNKIRLRWEYYCPERSECINRRYSFVKK